MPEINIGSVIRGAVESLASAVSSVKNTIVAGSGAIRDFILRLVGRDIDSILAKNITIQQFCAESTNQAIDDGLLLGNKTVDDDDFF